MAAEHTHILICEADLLNVALFGMTAKEWRGKNPQRKGNMRDWASLEQLLILANIESYNAILIDRQINQHERLVMLREMVVRQLRSLEQHSHNLPAEAN